MQFELIESMQSSKI